MMISYLATATLAVGLLAATPKSPEWEPSYGKALQATRAANGPLLVVLEKPTSEEARVEPQLLCEGAVSGKEARLLRPYRLCRVDVTTKYGRKVASAFRAKNFPHVAIIDKTGSLVLFRKSGKIDASEWERALTRHKTGERTAARAISHMSYRPSEPMIYSNPTSGSYCPSCQRRSF
jgi:hypothetical protein